MLSINIYLRFALIAVGLIGGIALWASWGVWYGIWFVLAAIVLFVGYVLMGTVQSATMILQEANIDGAEQRLNLTLSPRLLYATNRAYYYMLKGSIAVARHDTDEGEEWLKKAEAVKVPTDNERAMIQIQLANIAAGKGKWKQAQLYMRNIKTLKITEEAIREQVKQLEKALSSQGQIKAAGRMGKQGAGMIRQGGGKSKRRRPKMR